MKAFYIETTGYLMISFKHKQVHKGGDIHMLEKIKDIFYEMSDLLFALVIILVMSTVITWKVTDSLAYSKNSVPENVPIEQTNTEEAISQNNNESPVEVQQQPPTTIDIEPIEQVDESDSSNDTSTSSAIENIPVPQPATVVKINIPSGTPGVRIAKILKENHLIDDTNQFISRVEELKLGSKLRSGTFSMSSDTSLDDIIYVITGQKK